MLLVLIIQSAMYSGNFWSNFFQNKMTVSESVFPYGSFLLRFISIYFLNYRYAYITNLLKISYSTKLYIIYIHVFIGLWSSYILNTFHNFCPNPINMVNLALIM